MPVYIIADIKIRDPSWLPAYAANVHEIVHRHGGRYLARCGHIEAIEGPRAEDDVTALIAFPTKAAAEAFITDPVYAPFAAARRQGSDSRLRMVDDSDLAGTISYLTKP